MAQVNTSSKARDLLQEGLARYGRGEVDAALRAWREALALEPSNAEAQKLVQFVEERLSSGAVDARRTTRAMPVQREKTEMGWFPGLVTGTLDDDADEQDGRDTDAFAPAAGDDGAEPAGARTRRNTLVSALPAILAQGTAEHERKTPPRSMAVVPSHAMPTPVPPPPDDERNRRPTTTMAVAASEEFEEIPADELDALVDDGLVESDEASDDGAPADGGRHTRPVPVVRAEGDITRPIGDDGTGPRTPAPQLYDRSDTPIDIALAQARHRASQLVDECRAAVDQGDMPAAAVAADEALEEGDRAPMPGIAEVIEPARALFEKAFAGHVGRDDRIPQMSAEGSSMAVGNFDHRTGFLLSCIDGTLPVQTLIDISGMARFDCLRMLSRLLSQGIIKFD